MTEQMTVPKKKKYKVVFALSYEVEASDPNEAVDIASDQFNIEAKKAFERYQTPSNFFPANAEEIT